MYQDQLNVQHVHNLIKPLVDSGIYKNETSALNDIVIDFIRGKIKGYKTINGQFESKYQKGFMEFSAEIQNSASMVQEDDWMDWKAALEMTQAWAETLQNVMRDANQS